MDARELAAAAIRMPLDVNGNPRYYLARYLLPAMPDALASTAIEAAPTAPAMWCKATPSNLTWLSPST